MNFFWWFFSGSAVSDSLRPHRLQHWACQLALVVKNLPVDVGDIGEAGSIPGSGRSPGGGHGNHSTILAWRSPWREKLGRLQSMWSHRLRTECRLQHTRFPGRYCLWVCSDSRPLSQWCHPTISSSVIITQPQKSIDLWISCVWHK